MTPSRYDMKIYDEYYFKHSCGPPYERNERWLNWFAGIAEEIVCRINPRTVLDVGCAMGMLVEALRDRGVEAFGIDVSEYAIQQVREDIKPYCYLASILDPLPQRYDLIVCIEVLEHLPSTETGRAITNLCKCSDDILFSSTPTDYRESTHFNVQPPEYWVRMFSYQGFFRDLEFDASFILPWALRFRKRDVPISILVSEYERYLWNLKQENNALREVNLEQRNALAHNEHKLQEFDILKYQTQMIEQERDAWKHRVQMIEQELNALKQDYQQVISSRSWRLARKLSLIYSLLKRLSNMVFLPKKEKSVQ